MRSILFYYSITGNTKLLCDVIKKYVFNSNIDLIDITKQSDYDLSSYDFFGFATFTDQLYAPDLFTYFINKLPRIEKYAFVFNTYGFMTGRTVPFINKLLRRKGFSVINGFSLHTPENYPPMIAAGKGSENAPNEDELKILKTHLDELIYNVKQINENGNPQKKIHVNIIDRLSPVVPKITSKITMGNKSINKEKCTKCGLCVNSCPYKAVKLDDYPVFIKEKCHYCWACYNHCPKRAIYTEKYNGDIYYTSPSKEMREKILGYFN